MPISEALLTTARTWAEHDPDPDTRDQINAWISASDSAALEATFAGPLAFGTAGLRAAVGAGESRMNRAVVIRTRPEAVVTLDAADDKLVLTHKDAKAPAENENKDE